MMYRFNGALLSFQRHEHDVHVEHHEEGVGQGGNRNLPKVVA